LITIHNIIVRLYIAPAEPRRQFLPGYRPFPPGRFHILRHPRFPKSSRKINLFRQIGNNFAAYSLAISLLSNAGFRRGFARAFYFTVRKTIPAIQHPMAASSTRAKRSFQIMRPAASVSTSGPPTRTGNATGAATASTAKTEKMVPLT